ncbi:type II secretion system major pseudopilin GspG [Caulobacter sp. UNC279MFTsu5.1]|uniref:type II secretion system major pseudopilin GspG n=1 Tax=Caulobacter sp. UNC279MFTsu5.1 TaxID=1502775 RepID=UPI0008EA320A|nr:type II secretion system major pseudopilin GspG [Caulobacter sp. UNC279MFTsu5.1]SFJ79741.1 general secretion pathway protein G [Caulobacter sp. UNC279MFTsu5.1]
MLVVIAIIGLIAAVLTPSLMGQLGRARVKSAQLQLESVAAAVEMFHSDVGRYPTAAEGLRALVDEPAEAEGWTGPYLKSASALKDPWNGAILYQVADDQTFEVVSLGADRKVGGTGTKRDLVAPK